MSKLLKVKSFKLAMNLRVFDPDPPATPPVTPPVTPPAPTPPPAPSGKVFSEEYVQTLREEAKTNRIAKQEHEKSLRTILGLKDGESVTSDHITTYHTNLTQANADALSKANDRLVSAEIKLMDGYNHKLLEKLIDRTKVTVDDKGDVVGLKEATEALLTEFPEIKKAAAGGGINPPGGGGETEISKLETEYDEAVKKRNTSLAISIKNKIHALRLKKG